MIVIGNMLLSLISTNFLWILLTFAFIRDLRIIDVPVTVHDEVDVHTIPLSE